MLKYFFFKNKEEEQIDINMKYLIVGLGNMGKEYENTRHNVGFQILDRWISDTEVKVENETLGDLALVKFKGRSIFLLKPSTYMNLSGKSVRYWMQKKKILPDNLLVVVDDLHLPFGQLRLRKKGGDGGHNGLKDIDKFLGTNKYNRLKVGIGKDFYKGQQSDFVLGNWSIEENDGLPKVIDNSIKAIKSFVSIGLARTMNDFNR